VIRENILLIKESSVIPLQFEQLRMFPFFGNLNRSFFLRSLRIFPISKFFQFAEYICVKSISSFANLGGILSKLGALPFSVFWPSTWNAEHGSP
jgi:hypothetical protein